MRAAEVAQSGDPGHAERDVGRALAPRPAERVADDHAGHDTRQLGEPVAERRCRGVRVERQQDHRVRAPSRSTRRRRPRRRRTRAACGRSRAAAAIARPPPTPGGSPRPGADRPRRPRGRRRAATARRPGVARPAPRPSRRPSGRRRRRRPARARRRARTPRRAGAPRSSPSSSSGMPPSPMTRTSAGAPSLCRFTTKSRVASVDAGDAKAGVRLVALVHVHDHGGHALEGARARERAGIDRLRRT